jgi:hypothetical protein
MQISEKHKKKIEEIMADIACPMDFACYKSGFEDHCKVTIKGDHALVECAEKYLPYCGFRISVGYVDFCRCPLRIYAAKHLKK